MQTKYFRVHFGASMMTTFNFKLFTTRPFDHEIPTVAIEYKIPTRSPHLDDYCSTIEHANDSTLFLNIPIHHHHRKELSEIDR